MDDDFYPPYGPRDRARKIAIIILIPVIAWLVLFAAWIVYLNLTGGWSY